jgi:RNA polymerase sigma-70 factor, ECF subfamily
MQAYRQSGDMRLVAELYGRYTSLVYGVCLKYFKDRDASQDAVMDLFERLAEKLKTEEVVFFKSWLYMVAKNHCLMALRKKHPEQATDFMEFTVGEHPTEDPFDPEENFIALEDCLAELKMEQEKCVRLFYLDRLSYQQVSEAAGYELKAVKSFIQNGKRNLKQCLERKDVKI